MISRRIRRRIDREGVQANIAADVNIVASGSGSASSHQHVSVRQGRAARGAASAEPAPDAKEQP